MEWDSGERNKSRNEKKKKEKNDARIQTVIPRLETRAQDTGKKRTTQCTETETLTQQKRKRKREKSEKSKNVQ